MNPATKATETARAAREETGWIPTGGGGAYAFLSRPTKPSGAGCVLLAPLADERKSSLRSMVEVARALALGGITAIRIDYRGMGDSSGSSLETTLASMTEDAVAAADYLRSDCDCEKVALVGLRLGGAVALLAQESARADAVVMIEPVVAGSAYARELRRRQSIRRMLTKGKGAAEGCEDSSGPFDLDGTALDRAFVAELEKIDLVETAREFSASQATRSFVLQVGPRRAASKANASLAEALGAGARRAVVRAEPFWLQTDYVDPAPAAEEIMFFLKEALPGQASPDGADPGEAAEPKKEQSG